MAKQPPHHKEVEHWEGATKIGPESPKLWSTRATVSTNGPAAKQQRTSGKATADR